MDTGVSAWASGDPTALAQQFLTATQKEGASLGRRAYLSFVGALACAAIHDVLPMHGSIDDCVMGKVRNIMAVAREFERVADEALLSKGYDDDPDHQGKRGAAEVEATNQGGAARKRCYVDAILKAAVQDLFPPASAAASQGVAAAAAGDGGGAAAANGLPFPPAVVDAVIGSLDARSAAAAAAACRSLRDVHRSLTTFSLPAPLRTYLRTLAAATHIGGSDGSKESVFNVWVPLDGSPVAGSDLIAAAKARRTWKMMTDPFFLKMLRMSAPGEEAVAAMMRGEGPLGSGEPGPKATLDAAKRPPPHPRSSPLAAFKHSKAVPMRTPPSTTSLSTTTSSAASASSSLDASCVLTSARCDVRNLHDMPSDAFHIHVDGDLLSISYLNGWKLRDPGLAAKSLRRPPRRRNQGRRDGRFARNRRARDEESDENDEADDGEGSAAAAAAAAAEGQQPDSYDDGEGMGVRDYDTGFFNHVERVCSDAANGLVWAAADDGCRIKAFRAPLPATSPGRAGCNRGPRNGMRLQYTLFSDVPGLSGRHAGLHVLGDRLMCVKGSGALLLWDVRELPAQAEELEGYGDDDEDSHDDDEAGGGERFKGYLGYRDGDEPLEVTRGVRPHDIYLLSRPLVSDVGSGKAGGGRSRRAARSSPSMVVKRTCLLADADGPAAPTLAAVVNPDGAGAAGQMMLTWDLATQRVRQRLFGHLYDVTDVAAPPPAWRQPHLFASCAKSGDVKIWDARLRGGGAAVTLVTGGTETMNACVLTMANGGGGDGTGGADGAGGSGSAADGGGSQLGAGMLCFAGGACQSVWCWDLRGGAARPLYELSTGNLDVASLAWHAASNSLYAACSSSYEDRMGTAYKDDWFQAHVGDLGAAANDDGDDDTGDEDDGYGTDSDGDDSGLEEEEQDIGNAAGQVGAGGGGGQAGVRRKRLWPQAAVHRPDDFRRFFRLAESCTLRYRFSQRPAGRVPASEQPCFSSYY